MTADNIQSVIQSLHFIFAADFLKLTVTFICCKDFVTIFFCK